MSGEVVLRTDLLVDLERAGVLKPTSLDLGERGISFSRYESLGRLLGRVHDATKWWLADWVLAGEALFGEDAAQALAATGRSERTLLNYAWAARRVAPSRRREALSFTHHVIVAPLEPAQQRVWLERAEREGWSSRDLAAHVHGAVDALTAPERSGSRRAALEIQDFASSAAQALSSRLTAASLGPAEVIVTVLLRDGTTVRSKESAS